MARRSDQRDGQIVCNPLAFILLVRALMPFLKWMSYLKVRHCCLEQWEAVPLLKLDEDIKHHRESAEDFWGHWVLLYQLHHRG